MPHQHIDVDKVMSELTLEEKISLVGGKDFWRTQDIPRLGVPDAMMCDGPTGLRKSVDSALGNVISVPAKRARHVLPHRRRAGVDVEPQHGGEGWQGHRQGVPRGERVDAAGAGQQHQAVAAVRAQLRVLLRGPVRRGPAGRRLREGRAEPGRRCDAEALLRQQPGDIPLLDQRADRRAHDARDLPRRLREHREGGAAVEHHGVLQPREQRVRRVEPPPADGRAARRVRLQGLRGV
ncbi:hypothetical protein N2W54_005892 [Lotmaria passim]